MFPDDAQNVIDYWFNVFWHYFIRTICTGEGKLFGLECWRSHAIAAKITCSSLATHLYILSTFRHP
jgi:hypothetical protein